MIALIELPILGGSNVLQLWGICPERTYSKRKRVEKPYRNEQRCRWDVYFPRQAKGRNWLGVPSQIMFIKKTLKSPKICVFLTPKSPKHNMPMLFEITTCDVKRVGILQEIPALEDLPTKKSSNPKIFFCQRTHHIVSYGWAATSWPWIFAVQSGLYFPVIEIIRSHCKDPGTWTN